MPAGVVNNLVPSLINGKAPFQFVFSAPGSLVVATSPIRQYVHRPIVITGVSAFVDTPPTGASIVVDIFQGLHSGNTFTTLWGTNPANRPSIAVSTYSDLDNVPDTVNIAAGQALKVGVTQVGSTVAGSNLTVVIEFY